MRDDIKRNRRPPTLWPLRNFRTAPSLIDFPIPMLSIFTAALAFAHFQKDIGFEDILPDTHLPYIYFLSNFF